MFSLNEKVAIVTGGASGIGLAHVKEFLKNGLKGVSIVDINEEQGKIVLAELNQEFGEHRVTFVRTDVTDKLQIKSMITQKRINSEAFDTTIEKYCQFDILVNNAGIVNEFEWEKCLNVNFIAVMYASQLAIQEYFPKYKKEEAAILNVGSSFAFYSCDGLHSYSASKHAVVGFTKSCGPLSYANTKVKVVLCPHATTTDLLTIKKNQAPDYFASMFADLRKTMVEQSTEVVAKAALQLIKEKSSGMVWLIEKAEITEVPNNFVSELHSK